VSGLALALSWLTVLPVRAGPPDARTAAAALRWAPAVGGLVGAATGAVLVGLVVVGVPATVAGLLAVGFAGLATRGMHLDGLGDTADGLGCYGPPERALAVMRDGGAGPFAVVTLVVVVGTQAAALAALVGPAVEPLAALEAGSLGPAAAVMGASGAAAAAPVGTEASAPAAAVATAPTTAVGGIPGTGAVATFPHALGVIAAVALAAAAGRAAFLWVARRGVPAARPGGLGATVAGSQPWWVAVAWWVGLAGGGFALVGPRGALAVGLGIAVVAALSWHTARRFGGMTGDVLGAASELAVTAALVVLAAR
jgi:adenosylcobinamide-GDP ribazoletransferase